jgi:glucan phosphoethanolaminetransferase (alkaline phosphatase superfamily)
VTNLSANGNGAPARRIDQPEPVAGILRAAAGVTGFVGVSYAISGLGHIQGVMATAQSRGYAYDFRYAALLLVGITVAYAGVLCIWAVRGLAHGQRHAWDRALSGTLLLLLVSIPLIPVDGPGQDNAVSTAIMAAVELAVLVAAWRRLEPG